MAFETINYNGSVYPKLQTKGFAAKFAFPFAEEIGIGQEDQLGYDIGCAKLEWKLPFAYPIDPAIDTNGDAYNLPHMVDYIFSSHCLEHLRDWVEALDYWATKLRHGGVLFLYLPHPNQKYWLPWNNRKHIHSLSPKLMKGYFIDRWELWHNFYVTRGYDLNHSFYAIAERI